MKLIKDRSEAVPFSIQFLRSAKSRSAFKRGTTDRITCSRTSNVKPQTRAQRFAQDTGNECLIQFLAEPVGDESLPSDETNRRTLAEPADDFDHII